MAERQLIVVVEGTAALGPYWKTILSDYLEKIVRSFYGSELPGQKLAGSYPELAMVVFNTHGPYSDFLVQRTGWTKNLNVFFEWLSAIPFSGGGFGEAAIAEGLAEALMMLAPSTTANLSRQTPDAQKHCILVAASNPHPLPTPVFAIPASSLEHTETVEVKGEICLADADTVAKSIGQCAISLSVISPKQLPKLRAIYNAGKRNPRASDSTVDNAKNTHYLVLLSENFMEARAASTRPSIGNVPSNQNVKVDTASSAPIPGPSATPVPPASGTIISRQPVPVGNIPTANVKVEPTTVSAMVSAPGFSHLPSIPNVASQGVPSIQTSSPSPTSQETIAISESMQEFKPLVSSLPQTRPVGPAPANVSILNNISQRRQLMNTASIAGASSLGLQNIGAPMAMHMSNMISSGMPSSGIAGLTSVAGSGALMASGQVTQNTTLSSFPSTTSGVSGNANIGLSPALANLQGNTGIDQSVASVGQGGLTSGAQIGQSGIGMNQNIMGNLGANTISSGPGTMIPTPGMSQQASVHSLGMTNNAPINMPLAASGVQQGQSKYIKIWEGNLSGQRQGQPVFICKLEGYRSASASETLAADWPNAMQIVRLISQDHMNNKQYVGKADFLVFRTLNQHGFLVQLQEKKLCAVIQLPSQTLLLSVSEKASRLIGMLFPGDMVVFKPQVPNQQQMQQQQSQQQQIQQQQQQMQQAQQQHLQHQQLQQQTQPHQQQQQQPMVGSGMNQTFVPGPGRPQMMSQPKVQPSQGPGNMSSGGFLP
ncbi:mediator of RNA polymerase II transcription subunit 25 isoform X1 [Dioscorea cayenensis subsp. rotundata]|uniref:Mediator of RNA polymerase II transcription subunit 25 n=1 Tax=Dioscorea cayennensis subsp. rotundata TaxID=55577 RepID=A0AB40ALK5_DIOCR|nr:mediator of RNA polymerase II transcription subunit 25 isoform X1 [Dioscorea cayenensis subsp. rotundata]